ncbi:MAG TPA: alpha/beta hydrolase [Longimicrobiales bacterium]
MRGVILGLLAAAIWGAPALAAPRFSEIRLSTGVRLHYAEEGPANGSPVIMLHGLSDSWFSFSKVMPLLGKRHRVYALDLRGHGNSDKPATGYHMRNLAEDVVAFMDAQKIARATIVGHSMGSFVAQQVALAAPHRVSRLVLVGSGTTPNEFGGMQEFYDAAAALPEPVPEAFARDFQVSTIYRPVGDAFLERAIDESLKLPSRVWRELVKGMSATDAAVGLGRLNIPTLVLAGDKDTFALPKLQPPLVAMLKSAKLKMYKETGHAVHWERPDEFARDVDLFMNGKR